VTPRDRTGSSLCPRPTQRQDSARLQGYQDFRNVVVTAIDGVQPRNFLHAVELVENGDGEFLTLSLADTNTVVLNRSAARSRHAAILARYHVAFDRSADLREERKRPVRADGEVSGGSAFCGARTDPMTSKSSTTTRRARAGRKPAEPHVRVRAA
jgi:hypothetical protein